MNNKGFTLVELLVTIALIAIVSVSAGIGINQMLERQVQKNYDEFIRTIENAACIYAEIENIEEESSVSIQTLIDNGLLNKKLSNPISKERITSMNTKTVSITINDNMRQCSFNLTN